jgi:hypothetical protein
LVDARYVYFSVVGLEEPFDPGPRLPGIDPVDRLVALRFGSRWLLVAWSLDGFTPGLATVVEEGPGFTIDDPCDPVSVGGEGEVVFDGGVEALLSGVWAGLLGETMTGYDLVWHAAGDTPDYPETLMAVRLAFGGDVVTVMLGIARETGEVDYSADDLLVVRGAALGDRLVRRFLARCVAVPAPGSSDVGGVVDLQPWEELAAADASWDAAQRRVLRRGSVGLLRRGLGDELGRETALRILRSAPSDLVERLFPEIVAGVLDPRTPGSCPYGRIASAAVEVLGRLPPAWLYPRLRTCADALVDGGSAAPVQVSTLAWLFEELGFAELARRLGQRVADRRGGEFLEQAGGPPSHGDDGRGTGCGLGYVDPGGGGLAAKGGEPPSEAWTGAVAARKLFDEVLGRMVDAGRDNQSRLALRDACAAPAMLRLLGNSPPYWTQAVFGDVLGWALGSSDLVGPARRAIRRLPRGWVRFELSGRVADLAGDPGAGWEARTRMGQLLGFLGEADLLAVLRQGAGAAGPSLGGAGRAGGGGG